METEILKIARQLADNAFDCSTKFTYKIAQKFNGLFVIVFFWLIVLTVLVFIN